MRVSVKTTECQRIPARFLERERAAMPSARFEQEYMCCFTGDGTEYFDRQLIEAAYYEMVTALDIR